MDKERIKGMAQQGKGAMKEAAGKATGDEKLKAEGKMDKMEGKVRNAVVVDIELGDGSPGKPLGHGYVGRRVHNLRCGWLGERNQRPAGGGCVGEKIFLQIPREADSLWPWSWRCEIAARSCRVASSACRRGPI